MKKLLATLLAAVLLATSLLSTATVSTAEAASTADFNTEVETRYNAIMTEMEAREANDAYGNYIDYKENWYADLEPIEAAARMICGEAPWWIADKKCVAMVVWNRREKSWYPDTLYDVVVQTKQFLALTGSEEETIAAREIKCSTASWKNALRYVCIIWTARVLGVEPDSYLGVPTGYTDQLFFLSYDSFFAKAYDSGSVSKMSTSEGEITISDIFVPVHGTFSSVAAAEAAYNNENNASLGLPYDKDGERVNIYYSR